MHLIKCFGSLRLLKQLFIISLISCFILLGNCSVNAVLQSSGYGYVGDLDIPFTEGLYSYNITNSLDFTTSLGNSNKNMFYWYRDSNAVRYQAYFWYNNYLYTVVGNDDGITGQGYVQNWCITPSFPGVVNGVSACDGNYIYSLQDILEINPNFQTFFIENKGSADVHYGVGALMLCFNDGNNYYCVSCTPYAGYCPSGIITGNVVNIPNAKFSSFFNVPFGRSPFTPSSSQVFIPSTGINLNGNIVINSGYTNSDMVEGFECVGLQPSLCYGGFDIDNIFDPSEQFEDFTGYKAGQGATIFEIYNLYSGSFTSLNQFLNTVLTRYQNGQINSFKTEPKALLMLGAQMNTAGFKTSYIASYCNLLLNENNNNLYTGNSVDDLRVQSCLKSKKVGDSLKNGGNDISFQTSLSGIFSGGDTDFDPDTFFSNIMDTIDRNLDQNLSGGLVGFLPGYIVLIFLALVFIRLITH